MYIPTNSRGILSDYCTNTSTQARHQAKLLCLLDWIGRWGFTSTSVIEAMWGLDRSTINRMLKRYIKEELLTEVSTFCCRDKRLFLLKPAAIRLLEGVHGIDISYKAKPSTLNFKTVTHDLMVQYIVATGCHDGRYEGFITETEQAKSTIRKVRRFDAIVQTRENQHIGIEMEASSKTILHRRDCLHATQTMIEKEVVDYVLYFSHKRRLLKDAERVHQKLIANQDNQLDEAWVKQHIKLVYARDTIDDLYTTFWQH